MTKPLIEGVRSSTHPLDLYAVSRDLWPGGTLELWHGGQAPTPGQIVWPETPDQVAAVLRVASERNIPVIPYGAGSGVCGGARGRAGAIVLDLKGLQGIGPIDEEAWTVEADAGVNGQQLEDYLQRHNFTLGHSPSSIWCSTVGGWAAARSAGQFSSKYGTFEDMVLSMQAVSPARGVFEVGETGDAPDGWMEHLLGSEGTLAAITRVKMRIWRSPEKRWLRGYKFPDVPTALAAMRKLMQAELWPSVVRLYDPVDTLVGGRTKPKDGNSRHRGFLRRLVARADRLDSVRKRSLALPLALPKLLNRLAGRFVHGCLLIVGWEGTSDVVDACAAVGKRLLDGLGEDLGPEPGERWLHSRHAVSYKLMPIFERGGFADTMEVAARWSALPGVYESVRKALSRTTAVMAHMSHAYPEGGAIYFSFAGVGNEDTYAETWRNALDAVLASGATVTHHHGVGTLKARHASAEVGPAREGWRALKAQLDPKGILNPGRLFVKVPHLDPGPPVTPDRSDGLVRVALPSTLEERRDAAGASRQQLMFPWETLPAPPRWQRLPWQIGWTEVSGRQGGLRCSLGRGPRSASGSDLRGWLAEHGTELSCTLPVVDDGERWLGEGRPEYPWRAARSLLQSDLRPAQLTVIDGVLRVGFRGPAAGSLGQLASNWVPGGLTQIPWEDAALPTNLEACSFDDPDVVSVLPHTALRRRARG